MSRIAAILVCLLAVPPATAAEPCPEKASHFVLVFGADACGLLLPNRTHTWATFVRVVPEPAGNRVESFTISWLPADGRLDRFRPMRPEPGKLLSLDETLDFCKRDRAKVAMWGPFATDAAHFAAAEAQYRRLAGGGVQYRAVDRYARKSDRSHCVHAITDPFLGGETLPLREIGIRGTAKMVERLADAGLFTSPKPTAEWLVPVLLPNRNDIARMR